MAPVSWPHCPHCGQQFSKSSLGIHVKRCGQRAEARAERQLRKEENYGGTAQSEPLPDWKACPNCGVTYGPTAIKPHISRCMRLRPEGANGFCAVADPVLAKRQRESRRAASLSARADALLERIRQLFEHFDVDHDGNLTQDELGNLLRQCFPARCADAKDLSAEFATADKDGSGGVSFDEFVEYYNLLAGDGHSYDRALDMFNHFDRDNNDAIDRDEFLTLLNQAQT